MRLNWSTSNGLDQPALTQGRSEEGSQTLEHDFQRGASLKSERIVGRGEDSHTPSNSNGDSCVEGIQANNAASLLVREIMTINTWKAVSFLQTGRGRKGH